MIATIEQIKMITILMMIGHKNLLFDQELVNFSSYVDETGEVSKLKAGWHILTHPATIPKIRDLRDHCRTATFNLTYFVAEFLRLA